jgi:hypothetical protein
MTEPWTSTNATCAPDKATPTSCSKGSGRLPFHFAKTLLAERQLSGERVEEAR